MRPMKKSKACYSCAKGKRRCDKAQPICGRCDELDVKCRYPPKRMRSEAQTTNQHQRDEVHESPASDTLNPTHSLDPNPLTEPRSTGEASWPQLEYLDPILLEGLNSVDTLGAPASQTPIDIPWFLKADSWAISHVPQNIPPFSSAVFTNFTRSLQDWLSQWVNNGQCPFIHRQLYADSGLPKCMRDAYTSVLVHNTRTDQNETLVIQILEANIIALVNPNTSSSESRISLDTCQHLARTQALFIHLAIALFSPHIQTRAQAERHIQLFMNWIDQLWKLAIRDSEVSPSLILDKCSPHTDAFFDGDPAPRLWRMWVVAESIRRIWLLGTMTMGIYLTLQRGLSKCNGGVKFTARSDIWTAESAVTWSKLVQEQDPLFIYSLECGELFTSRGANEVDEFARQLLPVMYGIERVESWVARTTVNEDPMEMFV